MEEFSSRMGRMCSYTLVLLPLTLKVALKKQNIYCELDQFCAGV